MKAITHAIRTPAILAVLLCGTATTALAQTAPAADPASASDSAPGAIGMSNQPAGAPAEGGDIIVTGSRISRKDYTAESPILTIGDQQLQRSGVPTVEQAISQLPQFQPSAGSAQSFPPRGAQANINLRGLGTNRALVLLDGRRVVPANADGTVDVNILPQQLIQNVETITGGASAAYGSDAMAGVVNFRLRQSYKGIQLTAQSGVTGEGDAATYDVSGIAGTPFAQGRGHVVGFVGYSERKPAYRADRTFFSQNGSSNLGFLPQGVADLSSAPPPQAAVDALFARYGFAAGSVTGRAFGFNADNSLFITVNNPILNYKGTQPDVLIQNGAVVYNTGNPYVLQIPLKRISGYGSADYELSSAATLYANGLFTHYTANVQYSVSTIGGMGQTTTIPATNPFIPADLKTLLNARATPLAPFLFRNSIPEFGARQQTQDYNIYQLTGGVKGTIPTSSITYDVYGAYGQTTNNETFKNGLSFAKLQSLLNAADGGRSLCAGGYNPFGENSVSDACYNYLRVSPVNHLKLSQTVVEATFQGPVFSLPAGSMRFAAGASYRRNTYQLNADSLLATGAVTGYGTFGGGGGNDSSKEAFGELLVPVIHNTPFIEEFNLDLAARYSDYNSIGGLSTYKADFDWKVAQPIRFRGGYSRAARAPSLGELFGAPTTASVQIGNPVLNGIPLSSGDPCDIRGATRARAGANAAAIRALCVAQGVPTAAADTFVYNNVTVFAINQGNPSLEAEKADTFSIGTVLSSPFHGTWLSHISASVDFYSIKIKNAIGVLDLQTSLSRCFSQATNPTFSASNFYCQQLPRRPDGALGTAGQPLLNQAGFKTAGIDAQIDWRVNLADVGVPNTSFNLNLAGTYVTKFQVQQVTGGPILDYVGTTGPVSSAPVYPRFKSISTASLQHGAITLTGRWRHTSAVIDFSKLTNPASTVQGVPTYDYFDADVVLAINSKFDFQVGVTNIGNRIPPQVGTAFGNTDFATYDVLGRRFFAGVKARF